MPQLRPFRGIRYTSRDELPRLVCPPFDIISEAEQIALHKRHPHNAVHLELPRGTGRDGDAYARVAATYRAWRAEGVLAPDAGRALYVYRQDRLNRNGERARVAGIVGALRLEPLAPGGGILPHERTMPGPIRDRLDLMRACPLNVSPIYAIYRGGGDLLPYIEALEHRPPALRFVDDAGVLQRLWTVDAPAEIDMLAAAVAPGPLVIADGHHRYKTALAYHHERRGTPGGHDAVLCLCVDSDAEDVEVLPYHRAIASRLSTEEVRRRLADLGAAAIHPEHAPDAVAASTADHAYAVLLPGGAMLVEAPAADIEDALAGRPPSVRALDVVALHDALLPALFGESIDEIRFATDPAEISALVTEAGYVAGVLLRALEPRQVLEVALAGELLPEKASYFSPKAVTGLVFRSLDEDP